MPISKFLSRVCSSGWCGSEEYLPFLERTGSDIFVGCSLGSGWIYSWTGIAEAIEKRLPNEPEHVSALNMTNEHFFRVGRPHLLNRCPFA